MSQFRVRFFDSTTSPKRKELQAEIVLGRRKSWRCCSCPDCGTLSALQAIGSKIWKGAQSSWDRARMKILARPVKGRRS
jgi:hypothetical protein